MVSPILYKDPNKYNKEISVELIFKGRLGVSGYDSYDVIQKGLIPHTDNLRRKAAILRSYMQNVEGKSFLDLGCGSGFYSMWASQLGAKRIIAIDIDKKYLNAFREVIDYFSFSNIIIQNINLTDRQLSCKSDYVCALALIHWIYSCTATMKSLDNIIFFLKKLTTRGLFVEWIDPKDIAITKFKHLDYNKEFIKEPYNKPLFLKALSKYFPHHEYIGSVSKTREIYIAYV